MSTPKLVDKTPSKVDKECMRNYIRRHSLSGLENQTLWLIGAASLFSLLPDSGNLLDGGAVEGGVDTVVHGGEKYGAVKGAQKTAEIITTAASNDAARILGRGLAKLVSLAVTGFEVLGPIGVVGATGINEAAKRACTCEK